LGRFTAEDRDSKMESKISFIDLLKETTDLIRDHRPFNRGSCSKQISLIIRRELMGLIPKSFPNLGLTKTESLFVATVFVEPDSCRDIIKLFSRFWTDSFEQSLALQMGLELSIQQGPLKEIINEDANHRFTIKPNSTRELLRSFICATQAEGNAES
jgi:hypothetical protein